MFTIFDKRNTKNRKVMLACLHPFVVQLYIHHFLAPEKPQYSTQWAIKYIFRTWKELLKKSGILCNIHSKIIGNDRRNSK